MIMDGNRVDKGLESTMAVLATAEMTIALLQNPNANTINTI